MNMIMHVMLGVFPKCGLMIGRKKFQYLGKKVEGREMKMAVLVLIIHPLLILGFSALAAGKRGPAAPGITNPGFHGLSQVLYEYSFFRRQQRLSGFEGLADNTYLEHHRRLSKVGRYLAIVLQRWLSPGLCQQEAHERVHRHPEDQQHRLSASSWPRGLWHLLRRRCPPGPGSAPIVEHLSIWLPV